MKQSDQDEGVHEMTAMSWKLGGGSTERSFIKPFIAEALLSFSFLRVNQQHVWIWPGCPVLSWKHILNTFYEVFGILGTFLTDNTNHTLLKLKPKQKTLSGTFQPVCVRTVATTQVNSETFEIIALIIMYLVPCDISESRVVVWL